MHWRWIGFSSCLLSRVRGGEGIACHRASANLCAMSWLQVNRDELLILGRCLSSRLKVIGTPLQHPQERTSSKRGVTMKALPFFAFVALLGVCSTPVPVYAQQTTPNLPAPS